MYPGVVSADGADGSDNDPGPGVLVYLTPMGAGQTKGDSSHGWGSPLHSFWCCYGSAVESFSKVADSIFFYRYRAPTIDLLACQPASSILRLLEAEYIKFSRWCHWVLWKPDVHKMMCFAWP